MLADKDGKENACQYQAACDSPYDPFFHNL